jgi:ribosomal protein S18 acetylase RimI-like enzyme
LVVYIRYSSPFPRSTISSIPPPFYQSSSLYLSTISQCLKILYTFKNHTVIMSAQFDSVFSKEPMKFTYKTYRLDPLSPNLAFLTGRYAAISMAALTIDPLAFGMSYTTEASFSPSDWARRLSRPNIHLFICVAHPPDLAAEFHDIEHGIWVGMITQIGSTPKSIYWLPDSGSQEPLDDSVETHWHQTATWIDPAHRGRGVAQQLIETAVSYAAESIQGSVRQARIRAFTKSDNMASQKLYLGRGFPPTGLITIKEAIVGNGNAEFGLLGRSDWPDEMMNSRVGVLMERIVGREATSSFGGQGR